MNFILMKNLQVVPFINIAQHVAHVSRHDKLKIILVKSVAQVLKLNGCEKPVLSFQLTFLQGIALGAFYQSDSVFYSSRVFLLNHKRHLFKLIKYGHTILEELSNLLRLNLRNDVAILGYAVSEITSIFPEKVFFISRLRFKLNQIFENLKLVHVCLLYVLGLIDFKFFFFIWSEPMVENTTLNIERIPFQVERVTCMINLVERESILGHIVNFKRLMRKSLINIARVTYFYVHLGVTLSFIFNFKQVLVNDENRLPWQLLILSKLLERLFAIK